MKTIQYSVVGVTFDNRQKILSDFFAGYCHGRQYKVSLRHEPENCYDPNAVSVWLNTSGDHMEKVGYISKDENALLIPKLDKIHSAILHSIGPNYQGNIGLSIDVIMEE